jgi:hypothetical protein
MGHGDDYCMLQGAGAQEHDICIALRGLLLNSDWQTRSALAICRHFNYSVHTQAR